MNYEEKGRGKSGKGEKAELLIGKIVNSAASQLDGFAIR